MSKRKCSENEDNSQTANETEVLPKVKRFCTVDKKAHHKRNQYKFNYRPNFAALAEKYDSFRQYVIKNKYGGYTIDWKDPYAVRELTKVLLENDFGIKIELPIDQLCPTVTLRMNYILWLEDLMRPHIVSQSKTTNTTPSIRGIDIGTGASCIYPLLGVATNNWNFVATEIDEVSLEWAQKNITLNHWEHKIELRKPPPNSILLHVVQSDEQFDFCMCNPPFFASPSEKAVNPRTVCTATEHEVSTSGGEFAFISQIIQESLVLRERVRWYTSMIGRKVNVKALLAELHKHQITNIRQAEFIQGKTTRWAIGWSFSQDGLDLIQKENMKELYRDKQKLNLRVRSTDPRELLTLIEQILTTAFNFVCESDYNNYTMKAVLHRTAPYWQQRLHQICLTSAQSTNNTNVSSNLEEMQSKDEKEEVVVVEVQVFQVGSGIEYDLVFKYLHGIAHLGHDCFLDVYSSLKSTLGAN